MAKKTKVYAKDRRNLNRDIKRRELEKKKEQEEPIAEIDNQTKETVIKSKTKALGVKSVFNLGNNVGIVTTFGRGNDADLEYKLFKDDTEQIVKECKLNITKAVDPKGYDVESNRIKELKGLIPQLEPESRSDLLGLKPEIEKEIFGTTFDDTIRIQIGYAIFDIIKALATASAQIVYTLNSLERENNSDDVIGFALNYSIPYDRFGEGNEGNQKKKKIYQRYYDKAKENFIYFNDLLCVKEEYIVEDEKKGKIKKTQYVPRSEEEIYNILSCINFLRNQVSHFKGNNNDKIFRLTYSDVNTVYHSITDTFHKAITEVNKNFKNEENNLYLFSNAVDDNNYERLSKMLYRKSVIKSDKNLGFNLKKVRELAYEKEFIRHSFDIQQLSSFKSKLNKIVDLSLMYYFETNNEIRQMNDKFIEDLREARTEYEKEKRYNDYVEKLFSNSNVKEAMKRIIRSFEKKEYIAKEDENIVEMKDEWIADIKVEEEMNDFSKFIYYISRFLSGKEINILLTTLINKFQEIESFNQTVQDILEKNSGLIEDHQYEEKYELFKESKRVAEELTIVKSFSRMNKAYDDNYVITLEKDVLRTLGVQEKDIRDQYREYFCHTDKKGIKGFVRNNVIKSGRVGYVLKYIKSSDVYKIMKNKAIVSYVISQIPQEQLERYYKSAIDTERGIPNKEVVQERIVSELLSIDFEMLADLNIDPKAKKTSKENVLKEKRKSLFSLYYTVVYIFVKNMVQINARYLLGFYYLERDKIFFNRLFEGKIYTPGEDFSKKKYDCLTRIFTGMTDIDYKILSEDSCRKLKRYIYPMNEKSFGKGYDKLYQEYRNRIEHLSILSYMCKYLEDDMKIDSYFSFFHYVTQKEIYQQLNNTISKKDNKKIIKYIRKIMKMQEGDEFLPEKKYSKALLRAMNVPFGYTLARYKNLSYEKYFSY